ncbi:MAG: amidohydrolase [Ruaniaceae bacterium]|nr:amidohydrolase [Ruaniaceae bacterium]
MRDRVHDIVTGYESELIALRRDLHEAPEVAFGEYLTTQKIAHRLESAGITVRLLEGTGLTCDIGENPTVGLRADIDALPIPETTGLPYASTVPGASHACGHDLHAAIAMGAALTLQRLHEEGLYGGGTRVIFQPAEEAQPGGALSLLPQGVLDGLEEVYAVHCEPKEDVGVIGSRTGAITASSDAIRVKIRSGGGHTSRPHVTGDVVNALGMVITQTGLILGRRVDLRYGINLTWGMVRAGSAANVIPSEGILRGTLRCADVRGWDEAGEMITGIIEQILAPLGVEAEVKRNRGLPPAVNAPGTTARIEAAARQVLGASNVVHTEQSMGGEDFAWFQQRVPGTLIRLGTRTPGGRTYDLHQGDARFDERAIAIGAQVLTLTALAAERVKPQAALEVR